ncbi:MAG TPA: PAS domain-containing sensor histidine kinase [Polyangiaceae bacterium]|nr:PAS domain-containing sensor histidine kinase [Polyangiaceae bacterium]
MALKDRSDPVRPGEAALERLRPLLELVDRLLAPTGDGLLAFDTDDRYLYWSATMERITGLAASEVLGRHAAEVFPFLAETGEEHYHREALAGRASVSTDRTFAVPETDRSGWFDAYYAPLADPEGGGAVVGGVAIVREITERKRAEQREREIEGRFKNMADASPVLLWMSGTDTLCNFFNQTWLDFTGRTLEEEWGVGWAEGVHYEDFQRCMDTYLEAFNARRPFEMEYRLRRHDGAYRWILDRGVPRYLPDGTFAGYIGSCVDLTDRKQLEAELRESVRARDEFLSIAAHELRTPLTPIQLTVQALVRAAAKPDSPLATAFDKLEALKQHVARQARLVEDLLDVSRVTGGPVRAAVEDVDAVEIARGVAEQLAEQAREAGSELRFGGDPGPIRGRWDAASLERVVRNLLSNALKYGRGNPIEVAVHAGDPVRIVVSDHGIGISAEDQARIFERFERAVSVRQFGGFGLGLWITRQLVEGLGGRVHVESRLGRGSTFTVELPRAPSIDAGG